MAIHTPHPHLRPESRPTPIGGAWAPRAPVPQASAIPAPRRSRGVGRTAVRALGLTLAATVVGVVGVSALRRHTVPAVPGGGAGAAWQIDVASDGSHAVTALAYGTEAGLHVVRVPAAGAPAAKRRQLTARIGAGDVYLVSLGWDQLAVQTASPPGLPPMSFGARARFVKLYHNARGTGIQTGWR